MSLLCWEKKQEFKYKDLLQHASGVGKSSANRSAQQKANHLALGKYLETDLACEAEPIQRPALPQALDSWSRDLNKREALTDQEKKKLEEDNKKKDLRNESLLLASKEQKIAHESVLRLVEEQKREKEEAYNKILQLEKQLDAKQKLEMEIEELKGKLQVMKHLGDEDDAAVQNKTEEMNDELQEKVDNLENMEAMNQILVVKERQSNDELQEARKELIIV
ncbi:hypothetical protein AAZX31_07G023500 [Glycine max]